jgi:hypothetical protein
VEDVVAQVAARCRGGPGLGRVADRRDARAAGDSLAVQQLLERVPGAEVGEEADPRRALAGGGGRQAVEDAGKRGRAHRPGVLGGDQGA